MCVLPELSIRVTCKFGKREEEMGGKGKEKKGHLLEANFFTPFSIKFGDRQHRLWGALGGERPRDLFRAVHPIRFNRGSTDWCGNTGQVRHADNLANAKRANEELKQWRISNVAHEGKTVKVSCWSSGWT